MTPRTIINLGCGPVGSGHPLPEVFKDWRELRVDLDPAVLPDVVANLTDLSPIPSGSIDAIWAAHCVEHLYEHEVGVAICEFYRVLKDDGFVCVIVPDLQTVASYIVSDRMHEAIYESAAGPITAHDILFGHGPAIAQGRTSMAHRCGFTPTLMMNRFKEAPFEEVILFRRPGLELATVARKRQSRDEADRDALISSLKL